MNLLVVVDMQKDFVTGPLGTDRAVEIVPKIADYIKGFDGDIVYTKDIHDVSYLHTQEGENLPIPHCMKGYNGQKIVPELALLIKEGDRIIEKSTFGSLRLLEIVQDNHYEHIYLVGVCTGICVLSNAALIKAGDPESRIHVISDLCGCTSKESHQTALDAMELLQIDII